MQLQKLYKKPGYLPNQKLPQLFHWNKRYYKSSPQLTATQLPTIIKTQYTPSSPSPSQTPPSLLRRLRQLLATATPSNITIAVAIHLHLTLQPTLPTANLRCTCIRRTTARKRNPTRRGEDRQLPINPILRARISLVRTLFLQTTRWRRLISGRRSGVFHDREGGGGLAEVVRLWVLGSVGGAEESVCICWW